MVFLFLFMIYFMRMIISRCIHVAASGMISFLRLNSILLYQTRFFFIHLSVDGHLSCFHVLAVVNRAAKNIGVHVSF